MDTFTELGVLPALVEKLAEQRITRPTAVQCLAIPPLLAEKSVIFRSATGTGKTYAYLLPAFQRITALADTPGSGRGPALIICAPTIELCSQIKSSAERLLEGQGVALLTGSTGLNRQIESLKKSKPLAVVGNPGRLLLLAKMGKLPFHNLRFLILDEADRLTASDSREETAALVRFIADRPDNTAPLTVAACSATVTIKIREYLSPLLNDAALLETDEQEILRERIQHWAILSESRRKTQTLISFLSAAKPKKTLVFTGRSHDAGKVAAVLRNHHINAGGLYGGMDKKERKGAIDRFRSGKIAVLVSSDLSARGLDIPDITHVAALDVGEHKDSYIHRCGRTGRAGKRGIMVSIGDETEMRRLAGLEKKLGITVCPKELYRGKVCAITPLPL